MREAVTQVAYLAASLLFILGLRSLSSPDTARRGMQQAAAGMLLAVIGTLVHHDVVRYEWIALGVAIGSVVGVAMARLTPMTAMPQQIAVSHALGALAATLVGVAEYLRHEGATLGRGQMLALGLEVLFGSLTVTGSLAAFGKLQELLPTRPITWPLQNVVNVGLFAAGGGGAETVAGRCAGRPLQLHRPRPGTGHDELGAFSDGREPFAIRPSPRIREPRGVGSRHERPHAPSEPRTECRRGVGSVLQSDPHERDGLRNLIAEQGFGAPLGPRREPSDGPVISTREGVHRRRDDLVRLGHELLEAIVETLRRERPASRVAHQLA